ncbi:MAG: ATP-binding cassette domain-containing protein [Candidatus Marsarchaeota archaeon]|nr:ATP-binding cassette domain-containing protein [Candidatus Marsarchaeota archaeon]
MDIGSIDYWANNRTSSIHSASALAKAIGAVMIIATVVVTNQVFLLLSVYLLLVAAVFITRLPALRLIALAGYPAAFAAIFAISQWSGTWVTPAVIILKAITAAQAMVLLITTTPYPDVFAMIGRFLPRIIADGLFITYRSLFILLEEMGHIITAMRLRGGLHKGRYLSNGRNLSRGLGFLLLRAIDMSEHIYNVLRVRGYRGRMVATARWRRASAFDVLPLSIGAFALALALVSVLLPFVWLTVSGIVLIATFVACIGCLIYFSTPVGGRDEAQQSKAMAGEEEEYVCLELNGRKALVGNEEVVAKVHCLRFTYPDGTVALRNLDFIVYRGENVAILGSNGSGKSTLLKHLLGLLHAEQGEVQVLGHDPSKEYDLIQPKIGVVVQNVDEQLLGPTVFDDVAFGARNAGFSREEADKLAQRVMERLEITHLADKVPHYLSGGQKRKVALAGALVTDPEMLVLDEPFEGLDPRSRIELVRLLDELHVRSGLTVIMSTHEVDVVPLFADAVYVLATGGRPVAVGPPQAVFEQDVVIREASIEPPALVLLFEQLRAAGLDLGIPLHIEDAVSRILSYCRAGSTPRS